MSQKPSSSSEKPEQTPAPTKHQDASLQIIKAVIGTLQDSLRSALDGVGELEPKQRQAVTSALRKIYLLLESFDPCEAVGLRPPFMEKTIEFAVFDYTIKDMAWLDAHAQLKHISDDTRLVYIESVEATERLMNSAKLSGCSSALISAIHRFGPKTAEPHGRYLWFWNSNPVRPWANEKTADHPAG